MTTYDEAWAIITAEKAKINAAEEAHKTAREQAVKDAWDNATLSIEPMSVRYNFKSGYKGWNVFKYNAILKEYRAMSYLVTKDNVLLSTGGGFCLLQGSIVITQEEIEQLNSGVVPTRLLRRDDYLYQ